MPHRWPVIEVEAFQLKKHGQAAFGDVWHCVRGDRGRTIAVLADGLGSGIKANVLANLTATMAARYVQMDGDLRRAAGTIMETLPVCSVRQIAYSTFTIVDMDRRGRTRIVNFDNPTSVILRRHQVLELPREEFTLATSSGRPAILRFVEFQAVPGDRVVVFSDGVSQAGVGSRAMPLGWGRPAAQQALVQKVHKEPGISGRQLCRHLVGQAVALDGHKPKDDITCGVVSYRLPRELLLITGPPVNRERDHQIAEMARDFEGRKVICGGSTANLVARELGRELKMPINLRNLDPDVPPICSMEGFDLVTEGAITLANLASLLEEDDLDQRRPNAATQLAALLLESDVIHILAGTRINEALQDPNLPADLDIRRNILRRLQRVLTKKYLKDVELKFI